MAGGTITRIVGGKLTKEIEDDYTIWTDNYTINSGGKISFTSDEEIIFGSPPPPPAAGKYFDKGWWSDENNKEITEAKIGDTIRFHIETIGINNNEEVTFTVYDWDGLKITNDKLDLTYKGTSNVYNKVKIIGNKGYIEWTPGEGSQALTEEIFEGDEIELFVECSYDGETIDLPVEESKYLVLYEKEVLITVLIELPHSYYTFGKAIKSASNAAWKKINNEDWKGDLNRAETMSVNSLGLAGHSAMAIGDRYFDYGPDNTPGTYSEKEYDVDFNEDGDKVDDVYLSNPSYTNAPGRPWWGEMVARKLNKKPINVKLNDVLNFINLHWEKDGTNIYGEVHKIEFYVKENEAKKMEKWWEERYQHLKIYSVKPWTGEQCTTTVKSAIQEAFPFEITKILGGKNWIPDTTQAPEGLLEDLKSFISTSKQHYQQLSIHKIIKKEAIDILQNLKK